LKKVYIALNETVLGTAQVVAIGEDAHVFKVKRSPIFGNGAIPAFQELQEEEYREQYKERYREYKIITLKDFNHPEEYKEVLRLYESEQKKGV